MADIDFDQIPAQEQMVDNWGQPTPWMQALWQRLTGKISTEISRVDQNVTDVGNAATAATNAANAAAAAATTANNAATAATSAATLATTASSQATTASGQALAASAAASAAAGDATTALTQLAAAVSWLLDVKDFQDDFNQYTLNQLTNFAYLITILDDPGQPLSPAVDFGAFPIPDPGTIPSSPDWPAPT